MTEKDVLERIRGMSLEQKKELVRKIGQVAHDWEETWHGCASASLMGLVQNLGIENLAALKATTGLSGGLSSTGESACGALVGGIMVIGLVYGRGKPEKADESVAYQETNRRAGMLCDRFALEFGSTKCHDVQLKVYGKAWNMRNESGREDMLASLEKGNKCADVVRIVAELAAEVILEP
jgi:C_GCAxxG_C_C family probable redox protein